MSRLKQRGQRSSPGLTSIFELTSKPAVYQMQQAGVDEGVHRFINTLSYSAKSAP